MKGMTVRIEVADGVVVHRTVLPPGARIAAPRCCIAAPRGRRVLEVGAQGVGDGGEVF